MTASDFLPESAASVADLASAARLCQGCDLWERATQTVFGDGPPSADVMLVGEQPGDVEDREGRAFIGPAGRLLDRALAEAGIDREKAYVTNAVKHFKWEARGKRRIHKPPDRYEIGACKPWLEAEIQLVRPKLVVAMGATAARSLLNRQVKILSDRGSLVQNGFGRPVGITVHPSSVLRARDEETRRLALMEFVEDLRSVTGSGMKRP